MEEKDITLTRKYTDREILRRTLSFMKPVRKQFILGLSIILINVACNVFLPRILGYYMDAIDAEVLDQNSLITILIICASYLVILLVNMIFTYIETVIIQKAGQQVIFDLRQKVFEKIETFSHEQLSIIPVGKLVTRVTNDTNTLNELYTSVMVNFLKYSLTLIGIIVNIIWINPILSCYMSAIIVVILIATFIYRHYAQKAFKNERKQISNLNTFLSENLSGIRITQFFNQENRKKKEFKQTNTNVLKAKQRVMMVFALYRPFISFLYYIAIAMVFFIGFPMVQEKRVFFNTIFTYGQLTSFYNYTVSFFGPVQTLAEQFDRLQAGFVSSSRLFNILDMDSTVLEQKDAIEIDHFDGKIEFQHVYFAYQGEDWILKDVSFVVEKGQTAAFVGATGAGKTTILSLIVRNYDIQKGKILIDDRDITTIQISSLRKHIGQMLQDVFMFSGTIKDNITLRDDSISEEDIHKAIHYVNADRFINQLPQKLDTEVSERGANFSAGQRQLISFARTVITKPQIMILDEATANIDTETEVLIQDSLEKMRSIGTMLIVAHRLSTVQHADKIICLSQGKVIEQGTHQELLKKKGYYFKLYRLQYENQEE